MNSKRLFYVRLIAIAVTLFIVLLDRVLPPKELVFFPGKAKLVELFSDESQNGNSRAYWVNEENAEWRCELREGPVYAMCGISMALSNIPYSVLDLSRYSSLMLDMEYSGPASRLRVYMRNHNIMYSTLNDIESAKFMSVTLRTSDLSSHTALKLSEFSVSDWWKEQFNIPRELSQPDFRQIISFGIDQSTPIAYGDHYYKLNKIAFHGDWISSEYLYLSIIIFWMVLIGAHALGKILYSDDKNLDLERLQKLQRESQHYQMLSSTDALTKVPNRIAVQQRINAIMQKQPDLKGYALLVFDIDHFKRVNDLRGHEAGDRVLRSFAKRISESVRGSDFFARWGGEEFLLLVKTEKTAEVAALAEKLRAMIHVYIFEPEKPLIISVSVGGAVAEKKESFEKLFRRADEALYRAKGLGRNCVVINESR